MSRVTYIVRRDKTGQALIITVLAIGGIMLSATTIAGLIMLFQIRQTTDAVNSAKAIYAADAGIECGFYYGSAATDNCDNTLTNGSRYKVVYDSTERTILSIGFSANDKAKRAFFLELGDPPPLAGDPCGGFSNKDPQRSTPECSMDGVDFCLDVKPMCTSLSQSNKISFVPLSPYGAFVFGARCVSGYSRVQLFPPTNLYTSGFAYETSFPGSADPPCGGFGATMYIGAPTAVVGTYDFTWNGIAIRDDGFTSSMGNGVEMRIFVTE